MPLGLARAMKRDCGQPKKTVTKLAWVFTSAKVSVSVRSDLTSANLGSAYPQGLKDSGSELGREEITSTWGVADSTSARRFRVLPVPKPAESLRKFQRSNHRASNSMRLKARALAKWLTPHQPRCSKKSVPSPRSRSFGLGFWVSAFFCSLFSQPQARLFGFIACLFPFAPAVWCGLFTLTNCERRWSCSTSLNHTSSKRFKIFTTLSMRCAAALECGTLNQEAA